MAFNDREICGMGASDDTMNSTVLEIARRPRTNSAEMRAARMSPADFYEVLGRRILKLRETAGWSQAQLAEKVRLERANLSRIENGHPVSLETLRRIALVMRVPLHALLDLPSDVPVAKPFVRPPKTRTQPLVGEEADLWKYFSALGPKDRATVLGLAKMLYKHTPPAARKAMRAQGSDEGDKGA